MFKKFLAAIGLTALMTVVPAYSMDIRVINDYTIQLSGEIVFTDGLKFLSFVDDAAASGKEYTRIITGPSPGGSFIDSMAIGTFINLSGNITTEASGICASACAYIWAAGNKRTYENNSRLLWHAPSVTGNVASTMTKSDVDANNAEAKLEAAWYFGVIQLPLSFTTEIIKHQGPMDFVEYDNSELTGLGVDASPAPAIDRGRPKN